MSRVITSIVQHPETIMVHSPMQLDTSEEYGHPRSARVTPDPSVSSASSKGTSSIDRSAGGNNLTVPYEANMSQRTGLKINTRSPDLDDDQEETMCVCTPPQKVPRPPNSFILYRSRQQARVAAENPGLSNPQISQILGERWANEPEEVKALWKNRASEESKRHRQQHPDYKYQPRRRGSKAPTAHGDERPGRCAKCSGLFYRTPQTPGNPLTPSSKTKMDPTSAHPSHQEAEDHYRRSVASPLIPTGSVRGPDDLTMPSPELKRRRLTHATESRSMAPIQVNPLHHRVHGVSARTPPAGGQFTTVGRQQQQQYVGTPLPYMQVGGMPRPHDAIMPPPPRPPAGSNWSGPGYSRSGIADESLRLPPLQTAIASSARDADMRYSAFTPITPTAPMSSTRETPDKTPHEQIMSIPVSKKLGVLAKICPALPKSLPGSPVEAPRGPIIAVEGPNDSLVQEVGNAVERALQIAPEELFLKTWTNNLPGDLFTRDGPHGKKEGVIFEDALPSILQHTIEWHRKSKEIVQHVKGCDNASIVSENSDNANRETERPQNSKLTPIALVTGGFSLTVSDKLACSTVNAITNNYAPVDHWQWMATLRRGIVGSDLVVYVKPSSEEDVIKARTVEFQEKLGAIIVRAAPKKGLDEATERRLAFELIEWMRLGWLREDRPSSS